MRFTIRAAALLFFCFRLQAQTNNQTGSPYSLFGLGRLNEAAPGKTSAMGETGTAMPMATEINNLNPAAYAAIPEKSFVFDLGGKGEATAFSNSDGGQDATTFSFSNIAFAFALSAKDGIGATLLPYSDVGYNITGIAGDIEGSDGTYASDVSGSGGLSNFTVNYGRRIGKRFNVGLGVNYLFGKIQEDEFASIGNDLLVVNEKNYYRGFRFVAGAQAKIGDKFASGATVKLPASINATKDITAYKVVDLIQTSLESSIDVPMESFKLPLEVTVGAYYRFNDSFGITADYKRSFWNSVKMEDHIGNFVDQDFFGFGLEYMRNRSQYYYYDKIRLRAGMNLDNGYLAVNGKRISNYKAVFGIGLPIPGKASSIINLSYGFGQRGAISETLVKETYRTFSFNIVLHDFWFVKRKYD